MRIALLTDGIYPYVIGGMQKHSFYLARYFAQNKIEVDLYHTATDFEGANRLSCFSEKEKKYIHSILIPFPKFDKFPGHYIREMYAYSKNIFEHLKMRQKPDFIYVQGLCGMKLFENRNQINAPIGVNFHGLEMFQKAADIKTKLEQYFFKGPVLKSMKNADVVFSLGGKLSKIISDQGVSKKKIIEIPIGVDESWLKKNDLVFNDKRKFVFIGRYERRKGIEELSNVIKKLTKQIEFDFDFIGDIPKNKQIKQSNIKYYGSIKDAEKIKEILNTADVLVCPSYSEGMPTVILEAMASGLAVIATDVGAVREQVDKTNGLLIQPGNIRQLKEVVNKFIQMEGKDLMKLKLNSIEKIKSKFLWNFIISQTIKEIELVVNYSKKY